MAETDTSPRGRLSTLARRLLLSAVPMSVLAGSAMWVQGKTVFTPDVLKKHGFKLLHTCESEIQGFDRLALLSVPSLDVTFSRNVMQPIKAQSCPVNAFDAGLVKL